MSVEQLAGLSRSWRLTAFLLVGILMVPPASVWARGEAAGLPSAQSYTGIINMPTARVMPDWSLRLHYGDVDPYRFYGGALGLWDRLEFHGQFTEITSIDSPFGPDYGYAKDRSAGARMVLLPEGDFWPQLAAGFFDATGTALFASRYLVASKKWGDVDLTFGLGQGILAGEYVPDLYHGTGDLASSFLFSSLDRKTEPFAGLEWHVTPRLTLAAESSGIDLDNMVGYRSKDGKTVVMEDNSKMSLDLGLKYRLTDKLSAQAFLLGGVNLAGSLSMDFPLGPEGMLPWKKISYRPVGEGERWRAYNADNEELAALIGQRIRGEGFSGVAVSVAEGAVWIEAINAVHLSDSRALGHIFRVTDPLLPERIQVIYLNLKQNGQVVQSLRTSRADLQAYLGSFQDSAGFLAFADLDLYGNDHWREYLDRDHASKLYKARDEKLSYAITPKVKTFLNNRSGFFKHKVVLRARGDYSLHPRTKLAGEFEVPLYNEFDELEFSPLERDAVRTDLVSYEEQSSSRLTVLALDQSVPLPYQWDGRLSAGYFESAYAGFGGECFRYFNDGLWGIGLETEAVRKRSFDDNFALREDLEQWFTTGFVNLYAQLWPEQGLEGGVKVGRFLAGDPGVRFELRRSFRYFTIGAWYTKTDTSQFESESNRGSDQQGVYVSIPLSIFFDRDRRGSLDYELTSFTSDAGSLVRQPRMLYPVNPWATPANLRRNLNEMRGM